ncbi:MAG: HAMP domain-containing sensor histidine kinase, partial [Candidatus Kapaibacterium sp.]
KNIQNAYEKEKELNVMKSRFISMISHEFRTPMTVITSSAEIISMIGSKFLDDKAVKLAQKIKNSVKQMTLLIDEVIAFNNTERTHVNLLYENFEIVDFVRELVDEQKTVNKVNNIVNLSSDFNEINIVSDKQLLRHILSNIIGNAIKYTPEGKKVNIRIEKKQNLIHFLVSDEGVGIPSSDLDKIWEPFVRGRNIKNISGTGFGLYIVKDFVNKLNGEIKVTSKLDIGTNVSLIVPTTVN